VTTLTAADGTVLEARWDGPEDAGMAVVFCHPHPGYGGTMTAPLMNGVTDGLTARGFAVLRFNFRGVGESGGHHDDGEGEVADVAAAVAAAEARHPRVSVCGWSFGAAMALRWMARSRRALPFVGIAPPPQLCPPPDQVPPGPKLIVVGDREQVIDLDALRAYATAVGATVETLVGSDHFFVFRHAQVAEVVAGFLSAE